MKSINHHEFEQNCSNKQKISGFSILQIKYYTQMAHLQNSGFSQQSQKIQNMYMQKQYYEQKGNRIFEKIQSLSEGGLLRKLAEQVKGQSSYIRKLKSQNEKLLQKNRQFQLQLEQFQKKINSNQMMSPVQHNSFLDNIQDPTKQISSQQQKISQNSQRSGKKTLKKQQQVQQTLQLARQQQQYEQQSYEHLEILIKEVLRCICKKYKLLEDINGKPLMALGSQKDFITVRKQTYNRLLDFYCQQMTLGLLFNRSLKKSDPQIDPKNEQNNINLLMDDILTSDQLQVQGLQKMFQKLATNVGLQTYWDRFLKQNTEKAVSLQAKIQKIIQPQRPSHGKVLKREEKTEEQSFYNNISSIQNQTAQQTDQQIADRLFQKVNKLIKQLEFTSKQLSIWETFSERVKKRYFFADFDKVEEKNKKNLKNLSEFFSQLLNKSFNYFSQQIIRMLAVNPEQLNQQHPFIQQVLQCSSDYRYRINEQLIKSLEKVTRSVRIDLKQTFRQYHIENLLAQLVEKNASLIQKYTYVYNGPLEYRMKY